MRFPQLKVGDQFEYQGERWTKTGPLTAVRQADNRSAMIPRYASVVRVEDGVPVENAADVESDVSITLEELDRLLATMVKRVLELLEGTAELSDETRQALRSRLNSIRQDVEAMARQR